MTQQDLSMTPAESLSAFADGEASELELRRVLKALEQDAELSKTWSRYHLIGAALRQEQAAMSSAAAFGDSFSDKLRDALADEPVYGVAAAGSAVSAGAVTASTVTRAQKLWSDFGRAAIAASVAGGLVLGGLQLAQEPQFNAPMASVAKSPAAELPSGINVPALSARTVAVQSSFDTRAQDSRRVMYVPHQQAAPIYNEDVSVYVNDLFEEHAGSAATLHQGILPYTRVILLDEE